MQEGSVRGIDADLERLQPIAVDMPLERERVAVERNKAVDFRKRRRLAFTQIRPENAALLDHRIGPLPDTLAQRRALGLGRRFQALAGGVEQPAVKRAAQTAILQPAEREIGAAMRAMPRDQAVAVLLVAKQHELLAEQFDRADRPRPL